MQRLLNHARWDAGQVRDVLRAQLAERLGDAGGVVVVDDTGFEEKGRRSAGCSASTPAPQARSPTARSVCSARM